MKIKIKYLCLIFLIFTFNFVTTNKRPELNKRAFTSPIVDTYIEQIKTKFKNEKLSEIFENCFPTTLDTTVEFDEAKEDTFVITGDIKAMWLRDSSFQVFPYLKFASSDAKLKKMMLNLIKRQVKSILIDPYANAFNKEKTNSPWQSDDTSKLVNGTRLPAMNEYLWERKYELDSTISTLFFAYNFYKETGETSFIEDSKWQDALELIINLVRKQSRGSQEEDDNGGPEYMFQRNTEEPFDSLHQGRGNPVNSCGLVKTMFRNSDDSALFAYNIPENAFLVATFENISKMLKFHLQKNYNRKWDREIFLKVKRFKNIISDLDTISVSVKNSIYSNGVFTDSLTKEKYFAYEVDCYGNHYFIDDPGYPSLISMSFFGFINAKDPLYLSTRKRLISNKNPYYFKGLIGEGLGSAHTARNFIWPLFNIMRVLTSDDDKEILDSIDVLLKTAEDTGFMHESVYVNDPKNFTRSWFAWANSFFGYMINNIIERKPQLLLK
jgi:meiotically up-regulated gene 157 (Mug157) protein